MLLDRCFNGRRGHHHDTTAVHNDAVPRPLVQNEELAALRDDILQRSTALLQQPICGDDL